MGKTIFFVDGKTFYKESHLVTYLCNHPLPSIARIVKFKNARKTDVTSEMLEKHKHTIKKRKYYNR